MASYDYEYYVCPQCKNKGTTKKCLGCGIKTKGQGKVSARFRLIEDGIKKNKRTEWYTTKKEAELECSKAISAAPKIDYRLKDGRSYVFEDLYGEFIAENALGTTGSTQYDKEKTYHKYILPKFKGKDVRHITKTHCRNWQTWLFSQTYKPGKDKPEQQITNKYGRKIKGFLNTFLNWVFEAYEIPNILLSVKPPKDTNLKKPKEFLEASEFQPLKEVSKDDILWHTVFCFMFHTGARVGEIQAISERDIRNGDIYINKTVTLDKNGKSTIGPLKNLKAYSKPIDNHLIAVLTKYINWKRQNNISETFLFGGDEFIDVHKYARQLEFYLKEAKTKKHITPHSFRHSYVSMLVDMDCSTKTVSSMIGDTEEVVIKTYSHLYTAKKRLTVDKLNGYLNKLSGTDTGTKVPKANRNQRKLTQNTLK